MYKIVAISDMHGSLNTHEIPECDLLLIGGDVCPVSNHERRFQADWLRHEFGPWLDTLPAKNIVGVGGNHDFVMQDSLKFKKELNWHLLYDEEVVIDGVKIWGSPYSPLFGNWAFMKRDGNLAENWEKIPSDVDILMVHGPMHGYGDLGPSHRRAKMVVDDSGNRSVEWEVIGGEHTGSATLRNRLEYGHFPNLKLFVFGHIHEGYGVEDVDGLGCGKLKVANVSRMDASYNPTNPPMEFTI